MTTRTHAMPFGAARAARAIRTPTVPLPFAGEQWRVGTPFPRFRDLGFELWRAAYDECRTEFRRFTGGKLERTGRHRSWQASWLAPLCPRRPLGSADG
jgi:1,4-alpha-glucan branching enzyme